MAAKSVGTFLQGFTPLFYLKTPASSSFREIYEIPNYVQEVELKSAAISRGLIIYNAVAINSVSRLHHNSSF